MGTRFRTMLAPIDAPTGDSRRFKAGGISMAPTPFPFEWVRSREGGHDGAVSIGAVHETALLSIRDAVKDGWISQEAATKITRSGVLKLDTIGVFAKGELFDDADREAMPTLAEDVATAMHLADQGVTGPSVDLDSAEGYPVREGTDEPVTWDELEAADEAGEEIKLELLITEGRVRAATLVSIPAFMETSAPLELITEVEPADTPAALIASMGAATATRPGVDAALFEPPALDGPTPITYDWERGQAYGHIWDENSPCHLGIPGGCTTAPADSDDYSWFNRFPVETADGGVVWAGRLTAGGRHASLDLDASGAMGHHDRMTVVADVVARRDQHGILIAGPIRPNLSASVRGIMERRKVSGDWREGPQGLALVEVLALPKGPRHVSEPGFEIGVRTRYGRQTALVASLGPQVEPADRPVDIQAEIRAGIRAERERELAAGALRTLVVEDRNAARGELAAMIQGGN